MKYFASLDFHSGYWKCHISEYNIPKIVFLTQYRLYEWVIMPMGLVNTLVLFMQTRNNLFMDVLYKRVVVFLDNILIYNTMVEEHFKFLEKVFTYLCKYALFCKLKKCSFLQKTTTFFGFDIAPEDMHIRYTKVRSLKELLKPTTIQ